MEEISGQRRFLPEATWLIVHRPSRDAEPVDCGTIQGLASSQTLGAIQNVGIVPEHRGRGLGRALVLKSLYGFRTSGLSRVTLEVTATNVPAVELYKSIGFQVMRTTYRAVQPDESHAG